VEKEIVKIRVATTPLHTLVILSEVEASEANTNLVEGSLSGPNCPQPCEEFRANLYILACD
jgi:hypothetical protein